MDLTEGWTDHGMGVSSVPYLPDPQNRTYVCQCFGCLRIIGWTESTGNIASNLSDCDWFPTVGYNDNDLPQGQGWLCSNCGPYARQRTEIPAAFRR